MTKEIWSCDSAESEGNQFCLAFSRVERVAGCKPSETTLCRVVVFDGETVAKALVSLLAVNSFGDTQQTFKSGGKTQLYILGPRQIGGGVWKAYQELRKTLNASGEEVSMLKQLLLTSKEHLKSSEDNRMRDIVTSFALQGRPYNTVGKVIRRPKMVSDTQQLQQMHVHWVERKEIRERILEACVEFARADQGELARAFAQCKHLLLQIFPNSKFRPRGSAMNGTALRPTRFHDLDLDIDWLVDSEEYLYSLHRSEGDFDSAGLIHPEPAGFDFELYQEFVDYARSKVEQQVSRVHDSICSNLQGVSLFPCRPNLPYCETCNRFQHNERPMSFKRSFIVRLRGIKCEIFPKMVRNRSEDLTVPRFEVLSFSSAKEYPHGKIRRLQLEYLDVNTCLDIPTSIQIDCGRAAVVLFKVWKRALQNAIPIKSYHLMVLIQARPKQNLKAADLFPFRTDSIGQALNDLYMRAAAFCAGKLKLSRDDTKVETEWTELDDMLEFKYGVEHLHRRTWETRFYDIDACFLLDQVVMSDVCEYIVPDF